MNIFKLKAHAMARTVANDPLQKYMFRVTIPGLPSGLGFSKVSGLVREMGVTEYSEGGYPHNHKLSGKEKVEPVTCERGEYASKELEVIYKKMMLDPNARTTVIIEHLDKYGQAKRTFKLAQAWVSKWEGSDLDAMSDDTAIERITIQFEHFIDQ